MKRLLLLLAVAIWNMLVVPTGVGSAPASFISTIDKKYDELVQGCSCQVFENPNWNAFSRPIFFSDIRGHNAWMNILGNMESLTLFRLEEPDRSGRKGDRLLRSYWSATARVTCDFTVTSVCDGKSECDGFGIAAMISVVYGSQRVQMRGYGGCGC